MAQLTPRDAAINGQFIPRIVEQARQARSNYAAYKHAEQAEQAQDYAGLQAAATGSGANIDNATRQKFRAILTSRSKRRGFTDDELAQAREIVEGTFVGNAARLIGKLAPSGIVSGGLSAALGHAVGHTIGVPALGLAAKHLGDTATRKAATRLNEMIRLRSALARQMGATPLRPRVAPGAGLATSLARFGMPQTDNPFENPSSP
jgi:hypothetical protein